MVFFGAAIAASLLLLWVKWLPIELLLYSLFPFLLFIFFDEISTAYKTPFILMCALILSIGGIGYQRMNASRLKRVVFLLVAVVLTSFAAFNAVSGYWDMAENLGYERCFPGASGCSPLPEGAPAWWVLFFIP